MHLYVRERFWVSQYDMFLPHARTAPHDMVVCSSHVEAVFDIHGVDLNDIEMR